MKWLRKVILDFRWIIRSAARLKKTVGWRIGWISFENADFDINFDWQVLILQTFREIFRLGDPNLMRLGDELCSNLELFFEGRVSCFGSLITYLGIEIRPSILHGDLWAGNYAACDGQPAIFDPATYYGHHEAEFGMSWCGSTSNPSTASRKIVLRF